MASEVAPAPSAPNQQRDDAMSTLSGSTSHAEPQVNGRVASQEAVANASGFSGNAALPATNLDVSGKAQPDSSTPDINPAGPTPVDETAPGIQPIADFVPKDASNLSHPTPPPDEPLNSGIADVDAEMANAESDTPPQISSEVVTPSQPEQSLVRPREDDGEDEPAAKRTRVEDEPMSEEVAPVLSDAAEPALKPTDAVIEPAAGVEEKMDVAARDTAEASAQDAHGESMDGIVQDPVAASPLAASAEPAPTHVKVEATQPETQISEVDAQPSAKTESLAAVPETQSEAQAPTAATEVPVDVVAAPAPVGTDRVQTSTAPMTLYQKNFLTEKMKNLKKTKHSVAFLRPVDPVALNIPSYPEIIKQPMDLGTMENKLKNDEYSSPQAFVDDFYLIIDNVRRFNGEQHAVTQAGMSMKAYFDKAMQAVPSADQQQPQQKPHKKRSPSISQQEPKRRESRAAAAVPAAAAAAPAAQAPSPLQQEAFALQSDGTPQIRRASSNVRPARAIKPPQNRELTYAKPKRKGNLLELKFCEHVLDEIRSARYAQLNHVFLNPVDPVALNIPNYRQVVRYPMDLGTMAQKLKTGQYGAASEFKKDFDLMIKNCIAFNPVGNAVRDLGIALQREFESLWVEKNKWEKRNAPESARASSASADGESDDEEEEEEGGEGPNDSTVAALKKQIAAMQSTLESLSGGGAVAKTTAKPPKAQKKSGNKKAGGMTAAAAPKAPAKSTKPKRERLITYEEKDEISKAVERMDEKQIGKLTEIITRECAQYRDMEEMELEIDDLPNNVQLMLLKYVREIFGNPNRKKSAAARDYSPDDVAAQDDDDFEPKSRSGAGGGGKASKRKKHAPMSKAQQEEQLRALQGKLQEFSNAATSGSESPGVSNYNTQNAQAESSGDEESEESEEE